MPLVSAPRAVHLVEDSLRRRRRDRVSDEHEGVGLAPADQLHNPLGQPVELLDPLFHEGIDDDLPEKFFPAPLGWALVVAAVVVSPPAVPVLRCLPPGTARRRSRFQGRRVEVASREIGVPAGWLRLPSRLVRPAPRVVMTRPLRPVQSAAAVQSAIADRIRVAIVPVAVAPVVAAGQVAALPVASIRGVPVVAAGTVGATVAVGRFPSGLTAAIAGVTRFLAM